MKNKPRNILFATTNKYKIAEANTIFAGLEITIKPVRLEIMEPQSRDASFISRTKAEQAYKELNRPVIVDDAGLFINRLGGFPGTITAMTMQALGIENLFKIINDGEPAIFQSVVSYKDNDQLITVVGRVEGVIRKMPVAGGSLLSDVFYPNGETENLTTLSKNGYDSHRKRALQALLNKLGDH